TFVNVPAPNHVSVMRSGDVDAEATWEPFGTMIVQQIPGAYIVMRGGGYLGYDLYVATSGDFVKKNPDIVGQLVAGFAESEWYIRHHQADAAQPATRSDEHTSELQSREKLVRPVLREKTTASNGKS